MSGEPTKYEASIEFCVVGGDVLGLFGEPQRCPDCTGHAVKQLTEEWHEWNAERRRRQHERNEAQRAAHQGWKPPDEGERCQATSLTTGKQCRRYAVVGDSDKYCPQHIKARQRAKADYYYDSADRLSKFADGLVGSEKSTNESGPE